MSAGTNGIPPPLDHLSYTDVFVINDAAGVYCGDLGLELSISLGNYSSILIVELMAIIMCAK